MKSTQFPLTSIAIALSASLAACNTATDTSKATTPVTPIHQPETVAVSKPTTALVITPLPVPMPPPIKAVPPVANRSETLPVMPKPTTVAEEAPKITEAYSDNSTTISRNLPSVLKVLDTTTAVPSDSNHDVITPMPPVVLPEYNPSITTGLVTNDKSVSVNVKYLPVQYDSILEQRNSYPRIISTHSPKDYRIPDDQYSHNQEVVKFYNENLTQLNQQASSQIAPYQPRDIQDLNYYLNSRTNINQGYAPVFLGRNIPVSTPNTIDFDPVNFVQPVINFNGGTEYFSGTGVHVGIVDGELSNTFNNFVHNPIKVDVTDILGKNYQVLEKGVHHGDRTSNIIAGRRLGKHYDIISKKDISGYPGIAYDAQLYYAELSAVPSKLGAIYEKMYQQAHPVAINNSFYFDNDILFEKVDANRTDLKKLENSNSIYQSMVAGMLSVSKHPDAPLFVFSSGNYKLATFYGLITYNEAELIKSLRDDNYGIGLRNSALTAQLLKYPELQQNLIVVSGFETNDQNQAVISSYNKKLFVANRKKNFFDRYGHDLDKLPPEKPTTQYTNVTSATGGFQCGVTMYHCITANYYYIQPFLADHYNNFGTSFAAPQVTAAATLLKQQFPWMSAANLKDTLLTTATDVGKPGIDQQFGWGVLNVANALRGPAMFAFGDFVANLNKTNQNSYFVNSIIGDGGLVVSGGKRDFLYLLGNNSYTGKTIINSGNLVVSSLNNTDHSNIPRAALTSDTFVNHQGTLTVINADVTNVTNNGIIALYGDSKVKGNLVQQDQATLVVGATKPITVSGTAQLAGTLIIANTNGFTAGNYLPTGTTTEHTVLQANNVTGKFVNKYVKRTALTDYAVVYQDKQVVVQASARSLAQAKVELTSNDSVLDQVQATAGSQVLQTLLNQADQLVAKNHAVPTSVVLTNNDAQSVGFSPAQSALLTLVTDVQEKSPKQLKHLMIAQAGSSYADMQLASIATARHSVLDFATIATSQVRNLTVNHQLHAYQQTAVTNRSWTNQQTQVKGKQQVTTITVGAYGQKQGINYGLGVFHQQGSWHEGLDPTYYQDLAHASITTDGVDLVLGKAFATSYVSASLFGNVHKYQVTRSSMATNDQQAKFYGQQVGFSILAGNQFYHNEPLTLATNLGITASFNNQTSFVESATGNQATIAQVLSYQAQVRHHLDAFITANLTASYHFMTFGYNSDLTATLMAEQALTKQRFNLELANSLQTTHAFDQRFVANLTAGYAIQLNKNLNVKLSGTVQRASNYATTTQAKLAFSYAFRLQ